MELSSMLLAIVCAAIFVTSHAAGIANDRDRLRSSLEQLKEFLGTVQTSSESQNIDDYVTGDVIPPAYLSDKNDDDKRASFFRYGKRGSIFRFGKRGRISDDLQAVLPYKVDDKYFPSDDVAGRLRSTGYYKRARGKTVHVPFRFGREDEDSSE